MVETRGLLDHLCRNFWWSSLLYATVRTYYERFPYQQYNMHQIKLIIVEIFLENWQSAENPGIIRDGLTQFA